MAIFHLHSKILSRKSKKGGLKSPLAIVAYRHRSREIDLKSGQKFDYSNRSDLEKFFLILPKKFEKFHLKNTIHHSVNEVEKRCDAQLYKEIEISLIHELTIEENIKNLKKLIIFRNKFFKNLILNLKLPR